MSDADSKVLPIVMSATIMLQKSGYAFCVEAWKTPAVQVGPVNYAYLKAGPLSAMLPPVLPPLMVVLGYATTLNGATTQVLQALARDRTVRTALARRKGPLMP